jgi:hypothetical protein
MPPTTKKKKTDKPPEQGIIPLNLTVPNIDDLIKEDEQNPQPVLPKRKLVIKKKVIQQPQPPEPPKKKVIRKKTPEEILEQKRIDKAKETAKEAIKLVKLKKDLEKLKEKPNRKIKTVYNPFKGENVKKNKRNIDSILRRIDEPIKEKQNDFIQDITQGKQALIDDYIEQLTNLRFTGGTVRINISSLDDIPPIISAIDSVFSTEDGIKISVKPVDREDPHIFSWTTRSKYNLYNNMEINLTREQGEGYDFSDVITSIYKAKPEYIEIDAPNLNEPRKKRKGGAFFPYYNLTSFDLSRYGIYNKNDNPNYDENCLIYSLRLLNMNEVKLNDVKLSFNSREIPQCKLKEICEKLKIQINLRSGYDRCIKFGDSNEIYNLGLLENHYFINEDIQISNYSIENYNEIKDIKDFNLIIKKEGNYYRKKRDIKNSSFNVIKKLVENKENLLKDVEKTNEMMKTPYYKKLEMGCNLEYPDECCKLTNENQSENEDEETDDKKDVKYEKWFLDIESPTNEKSIYCALVLIAKKHTDKQKIIFTGGDCVRNFLNTLKDDTMIIAHNMGGFDGSFFIKYLMNINECNNGNNTISIKGKYYSPITKKTINIFLKDSYTLIHMGLSKFPKCFFTKEERKNIRKEVMPHNQLTIEEINKNKGIASIEDAYKYIKPNQIKQFNKNLDEWKLRRKDGKYDLLKYYVEYCKIDVDILEKGYEIFRNQVINALNIDIDNVLTIASLADKYMISRGCYNDVYQISGIPREFIQKCVVGGRTMTRANKKFLVRSKLVPLDANSLYPSAISQMGFLKGKPKILKENQKTIEELNKLDGYFIRIKVNKINDKYDFPLLSKIDNKGIRQFTNEMENEVIYIDKISLEDAIKWHKLQFEILDGYYFDDGFNYVCRDIINELYQKRSKYKKEDNPIELVYKEILNCSYGKTILKASEYKIVYKHSLNQFEDYWMYNYNYIDWAIKINGYFPVWRIKVIKPINKHFSRPHIGVSILSMSKRIMNNVMCLSENNNLDIFYQDTDSLFIKEEHIPILEKLYQQTYNKDLIGDELGQFKRDFKLEYGEPDEMGERKKSNNVWSEYSIFLGKKAYINKLDGLSPKGEKINGLKTTLKGISADSIKTYSQLKEVEEISIFEDLLNGNKIKFDLLCRDVGGIIRSCKMNRNTDKTIRMVDDNFDRVVSFETELAQYTNNKFIGGYRC